MPELKDYKSFVYLSRQDVESLQISMPQIIEALLEMFLQKGEGRVEMPPKTGIHTKKDAFIHAMPAYIPGMNVAGIKWVSGYPENQAKGLPYITGLLILNDPETGIPLAVMDCTWITAMRTGAATAIAAKYLARKESSSVGIIACGVQGRSNLEALTCLYNLTKVKVFDINPGIARNFSREMSEKLQVDIEPVLNVIDAVRNLDIVVTSGPILKNPDPPIQAGWLGPGSFASLVDFDSYWQGQAIQEAEKIATDDHSQMNYYRSAGYFKNTPPAYADLGEIVSGKKPGRESPDERIISINLGLALDDMAAAILVYKKALEKGTGLILPL